MGNAYANIAKYQQAIDCYRKVIQINPHDAEVYYNLGFIYSQSGNKEAALEESNNLKRMERADLAEDLLKQVD